jgi:ribosomal-protein-alanine N-acetyltransferase
MRPDLTGRGLGEEFVHAGLRFARETYSPPAFRLTVAAFIRRAIRVYERVGFETVGTFGSDTRGTEKEWLLMRRGA